MSRYSLPEPLLQSMINTLAQLPYAHVSDLLGMVQAECQQQDSERAEFEAGRIRAEARDAVIAEQQAATEIAS